MALSEAQKLAIYSKPITLGERRIEILLDREPGGKKSPVATLAAATLDRFEQVQVDLDQKVPKARTIGSVPHLRVKVITGIHAKRYGWLPRTILHDFGRTGKSFGVLDPDGQGIELINTGVSYGAYKTPFGGSSESGIPLNQGGFVNVFDADSRRCRYCNGKRKAHVLYESEYANRLAYQLYEYCHQASDTVKGLVSSEAQAIQGKMKYDLPHSVKAKQIKNMETTLQSTFGLGQAKQVMLGVLVVESGKPWAAYSGPALPAIPVTIGGITYANYFAYACGQLNLRIAPMVTINTDVLRQRGNRSSGVRALTSCAAVKLLQAANTHSEKPISMSEVWFDPSNRHEKYLNQHTIESCNPCRLQIPLMLCPEDLLDFQLAQEMPINAVGV